MTSHGSGAHRNLGLDISRLARHLLPQGDYSHVSSRIAPLKPLDNLVEKFFEKLQIQKLISPASRVHCCPL